MGTNRLSGQETQRPEPEKPAEMERPKTKRILVEGDPKLLALVKADKLLRELPEADAAWVAAYLQAKYKQENFPP